MKSLIRKAETAREPLDLRDVADSAILYAGPLAREAEVEMSFAPPGNAVHLVGDADQLRIALNNLIRNATEALAECDSKKLRRICVELSSAKDHIELVVGDSGPGFADMETGGQLFRSTKRQGSGLGLFLVRSAAENNGGRMEIARSELGGAEIRMVFPRNERKFQVRAAMRAGASEPCKKGRNAKLSRPDDSGANAPCLARGL